MESIICLPCPDTTEQFKTESNENYTEIQSFKYICLKCGYGTDRRSNYNKHLNKKRDCTPVPEGTKRCLKCNQVKNKMEFYKGQSLCKFCELIFKKKCEHPGCRTRPYFGYDGKATHCGKHKQPDMESTSKTCEHPGCRTQPHYGYDGKATHCSIHKQPDMEYNRKKCEHPGCRTRPSFGYDGKATHCSIHKQLDMKDMNHNTCLSEWCDTIITTNKYDGYCTHCFKNLKPNDPRTPKIKSKTKEELVREFINEHFEDFVHDKPIEYGGCVCSMRRRVDHRKLVKGTMLAIETDEFQHKSYDTQQEEIRYDDLFIGGHSGKWIFIRFNPDGYTDSKGKKRKGMLQANGNRNSEEVKRRLTYLKEQIKKQIKRIECDENTEIFEIHKLFYDENLEHI